MITIIILVIIILMIYAFIYFTVLNRHSITSQHTLTGGVVTPVNKTDGVCSFCEIDKDNNKFIKYYFEPKDDWSYNHKRTSLIANHVIKSHFMREYDMAQYMLNNVPEAKCPKLFKSECENIEFNNEIFNKIRRSKYCVPKDIIMKKIVMEYIPYMTLKQYLLTHGIEYSQDNKFVANNMNKDVLIKLYSSLFKTLFMLFNYNIIPFDFENASNVMVEEKEDTFDIRLIDCTVYNIIDIADRGKCTNDDLFLFFIGNTLTRKSTLEFIPLFTHKDKYEIANITLKPYIKQNTINKLCQTLLDDNKLKHHAIRENLIKCMIDGGMFRFTNMRNLVNMYASDKDGFENMTQRINKLCNENGYTSDVLKSLVLNAIYEQEKIFNFMNEHNLSAIEKEYILSVIMNVDVKNFYEQLMNEITYCSHENEIKTLYYTTNNPVIAYDKNINGDMLSVTTKKYLKLSKYGNEVSARTEYIGVFRPCTQLSAFIPVECEIVDTMYAIELN